MGTQPVFLTGAGFGAADFSGVGDGAEEVGAPTFGVVTSGWAFAGWLGEGDFAFVALD